MFNVDEESVEGLIGKDDRDEPPSKLTNLNGSVPDFKTDDDPNADTLKEGGEEKDCCSSDESDIENIKDNLMLEFILEEISEKLFHVVFRKKEYDDNKLRERYIKTTSMFFKKNSGDLQKIN